MNARNLLIEETTFSDERIINTRIHSAFRFKFGLNRDAEFTFTLGDIVDLGEYEVKKYTNRIGKKSYDAVVRTLENHDLYFKKFSKLFKKNEIGEYQLLSEMKRKGLKTLHICGFEYFEKDCPQMNIIEKCFDEYIKYLEASKSLVGQKNKHPKNIEFSIESLILEYIDIVEKKREEYQKFIEEKRLQRMSAKREENFTSEENVDLVK